MILSKVDTHYSLELTKNELVLLLLTAGVHLAHISSEEANQEASKQNIKETTESLCAKLIEQIYLEVHSS